MKISVVIPVYNGEDFIQKSYNSIINQQLNDFEILYIDNNSKDGSIKNIQALVEKDARVKLFFQTMQGAAPARNKGVENAEGDYIYIFDVDDEIYPKALQKMIQVLDTYPRMNAVFGRMVKSHKGISETVKPKDASDSVVIKEPPYWGLQWFSDLSSVVGPPAFLYRKSVFESIGLYNESIKNNEDTALDIRLGMTQHIVFLDTYVYLYFKHSNSTIEQTKREIPRAFMVWPRLVKEHLPFYLTQETPLKFKSLLFSQLFQSMGRQVVFTKGLLERHRLKRELCKDIKELTLPLTIRIYLVILVILPLETLRKVYGYYLVPYTVKKLTQ
jgi:glycosyltransferase involved in cell wall biosynthesis